MPRFDVGGSSHHLHVLLGIPVMLRILVDEYDPSGRVFFTPQARTVCCGIVVACAIAAHFQRRFSEPLVDTNNGDRPGFLSRFISTASNAVSSTSTSIFRDALFISIVFWFMWPAKVIKGVAADQVCEADDATCRIANHYGPPICCINPSFCDAKAHNWIYHQGGTAQAYKPDVPASTTICDPEAIKSKKMRHKVSTWPYTKSSRKYPPVINLKLNLLRCSKEDGKVQHAGKEEDGVKTKGGIEEESNCCCRPMLAGPHHENTTIEIWQTRPDGSYASLRPGKDDDVCRAMWMGDVDPPGSSLFDSTVPPFSVDFTTVAPGSTGSVGGLGPSKYDFFPYGPPVLHILVRPGFDGLSPLLVDVPILPHHKTLEKMDFTWTDWRGPSWVKKRSSKDDQPSFNISSWEPDLERHAIAVTVDLYLQEDEDVYASQMTTSKIMCPSFLYGLPHAFFLEPISVCGSFLLDYFDL